MTDNIHAGQPIKRMGTNLDDAKVVVILLHGRGTDADSMVPLARELEMTGAHFIIPQAASNRWYPQSAFGPIEDNEPNLSFALERVDDLVQQVVDAGFSRRQIVLSGFSQGACLASEYVARNAESYAGLFVFSGALIGPPGTPHDCPGTLNGMSIFIGCSDADPWIPNDALHETIIAFEGMDAKVDFRVYPGMAHTINQEEIDAVRSMLKDAVEAVAA
jgi:predicted esterase